MPLNEFEFAQLQGLRKVSADPPLNSFHEKTQEVKSEAVSVTDLTDADANESDYAVSPTDSERSGAGLVKKEEPIIRTGEDVARHLVSIRDDGDSASTFRSWTLGTIFAGLGAALCQIYRFKPMPMHVSTVFLLLVIYTVGNAWAYVLPRRTWVAGTRLEFLSGLFHFINPGPFTMKEHVVATLVASTAASGSSAVMIFAVQRLFYDMRVDTMTAVLATFSTACFGFGIVGVLRPLIVYPSEMVYWKHLSTVTIFQALHFESSSNKNKLRLFWTAFTGMFAYEIIPAYIAPVLNGISVVCLASQRASKSTIDAITNIFGGASSNEGLGLLSMSFDWQYVGSDHMSLPLIQQANSWIGISICYVAVLAIYYSNAWNSRSFPMLSSSLFASNGSVYNQSAIFGAGQQLDTTALKEVGLPSLTGANVWSGFCMNLTIGALITHVILFWGGHARDSFRLARQKTQPDPHYQAMQRYPEVPWWWFASILILSFIAGLVVVVIGSTTLPWWAYIVSLLLGTFITPFSIILAARMGSGVFTSQLMKMVAGLINPGRPIANLYSSMWSHDVVIAAIHLASDLKIGQYLKVPPRVMFVAQIWGTVLGAFVNYFVMDSIVESRRKVLLSPTGTHVWSGQMPQILNSAAVSWSLAKDLYGVNSPYWIIPMGLLFGAIPTFIQWLVWKRWPKIGSVKVDSIMLPIIYMYSAALTHGVTSTIITGILVGITSQLWLRRHHPVWYRKYNYILGGALDGGAQTMIFVLSFAVFGASGVQHKFPHWPGNPARGNVDYCNGNGAFKRRH
ncbi:hypothetical protein HGRIS_011838 [Hohenbuehelia grisea]|uniref:Oligopeptide transporter n=1 Tax=Hohenbuehelia grisea TaxID=104357 RepID=A0ABR3JYE1_9AGAR